MIATPLLLALTPVCGNAGALSASTSTVAQESPAPDLVAIRAARVELGNGETLQHAVILVEDGKIVTIGEDLPIERGIPVIELDQNQVVMPGLVNAYSRVGMDGRGGSNARPWLKASDELYPPSLDYERVLQAGVTTLGQYPAGSGIPGRAVVVRPKGATVEEMLIADPAYLKIIMASSRVGKGYISGGFEKADEWLEKEKKNKAKWDKAKEKYDKAKEKWDKEKDKEKKEEGREKVEKLDPGPYEPIDPDPKAQSFLELREGTLKALISIRSAGDYLHLLDAIGDEEFSWDLRVVMTRNMDIYNVKERIGEAGLRVVMEPEISLHPGTMRQRNLPAELARAGAKLVLVPRSDTVASQKAWLRHVGEMVAAGLDYQTAIRAMTLEPAELLGVGDQVGSLEAGKAANLLILSGDPFEVGTQVEVVMLDGKFVYGEVDL